jgi:hypothetical protein
MNPKKFLIIALIVLSAVSTIESAAVQKCLGPNCRRLAITQNCLTNKCRRLAEKKKATPPKEKLVLKVTPPSGDAPPPLSAKAQAAKNKAVTKKPSTPAAILKKKTHDAKKSVADAKKSKTKANATLKKADSDLKSSKEKIQKLRVDLNNAKGSHSKKKDAKIQKIALALSKEQINVSKAKDTRLKAAIAADHANLSIASAKSRVPPKKGQEATQPNPGPPKATGKHVYYLKRKGKRIRIPDNLLEMKPVLRVRACLKSWCYSRGHNMNMKKAAGVTSMGCNYICKYVFGNPLAWKGKTSGPEPAEYPKFVAFLKANGIKID